MRGTSRGILVLLALAIMYYISAYRPSLPPIPKQSGPVVLGERTKSSGCTANGPLPDKTCTPGAVFANVTKENICTVGYSKPIPNVSSATKDKAYSQY